MTLSSRRYLLWLALAGAAALATVIDYALRVHLRRAELVTGVSLFSICVLLTAFNARKKLPFLPLLRASTWTQVHIYAGALSCVIFGLHTGWRTPHGVFEFTLALLFVLVAVSGFIGLAISRWMPARLTVHGENIIFERIPALRAQLRREVEELVLESFAKTQSSTISDFHESRLRNFFARRQNFWHHIVGNRKSIFRMMSDVQALHRYLNEEEQSIMRELVLRIEAKNNLDFQQSCQGLLKGWLFIHIPLTYSMILMAIVHGVMAWRVS
jgi:hypothetical protein